MASVPDILLSLLFLLLIMIDVCGNVLVCLVVYRNKQMRKPMNYLLVNLAVADIVIGVFMLPRHVFNHAFKHPTGILGLQPRDKAAMLVVNTQEIFLLNLHQNRVHFPAERNAFVLATNMAPVTSLANQQYGTIKNS